MDAIEYRKRFETPLSSRFCSLDTLGGTFKEVRVPASVGRLKKPGRKKVEGEKKKEKGEKRRKKKEKIHIGGSKAYEPSWRGVMGDARWFHLQKGLNGAARGHLRVTYAFTRNK